MTPKQNTTLSTKAIVHTFAIVPLNAIQDDTRYRLRNICNPQAEIPLACCHTSHFMSVCCLF